MGKKYILVLLHVHKIIDHACLVNIDLAVFAYLLKLVGIDWIYKSSHIFGFLGFVLFHAAKIHKIIDIAKDFLEKN